MCFVANLLLYFLGVRVSSSQASFYISMSLSCCMLFRFETGFHFELSLSLYCVVFCTIKKITLLVCVRVIIVYVAFFSCYKQFDGLSLVERTKRCVVCRWPLWLILNCRLCVLSCALFVRSILAFKQKNWIFAFKYPNAQAIETRILRSTLRFSFGTSNSDFSSPLMSNWRAQIKN